MPSATSSAIDPVGMTSIGTGGAIAEAHHRTLAVLLLDLGHGDFERLVAVHPCCHWDTSLFRQWGLSHDVPTGFSDPCSDW